MAAGKSACRIEWVDPQPLGKSALPLAEFDGFWFAPGATVADQPGLFRAMSFARDRGKPVLFTGDAALHALAHYAKTGFRVRWRLPADLEVSDQSVKADSWTPLHRAYRKTSFPAPRLLAFALDEKLQLKLFDGQAPLRINAQTVDGRIVSFGSSSMTDLYEALFFEPELEALRGVLPPLARRLIEVARLHLRYPIERCGFFLFDEDWCFFSAAPVRAIMQKKTGSIHYQGGFSVLCRPVSRVPFLDTDGLAAALASAVSWKEERSISLSEFKRREAKGNPVLLEFGLRDFAQLARRSYSLSISRYHNRFEISMSPWTAGGRVGPVDWLRKFPLSRDASEQERKLAFTRAAQALQTQFPPSGFEFKVGKGLVKEDLSKYLPSKRRKT